MNLSEEWLLTLLLLGLYLHDAIILTRPTAAFLVYSPRARWSAAFPSARFTLAGRHVFLAPQLPPATPVFQLDWETEGSSNDEWQPETAAANLFSLSIVSGVSFVAVLLLLPLVLLTHQPTFVVALAILGVYVCVLASIACLWLARSRLGLTRSFCGKLSFEMLVCPPIAASLVRRVALAAPISGEFVRFARRLTATKWESTSGELVRRIDIRLEEAEVGSIENESLKRLRERLT